VFCLFSFLYSSFSFFKKKNKKQKRNSEFRVARYGVSISISQLPVANNATAIATETAWGMSKLQI
jgi:hypothetical protein